MAGSFAEKASFFEDLNSLKKEDLAYLAFFN